MKGQGDRSLPRSMSETGRRSVGNRKEHRLRCDYASSPDSGPWQGSGAGPLSGVWGGNPNVPQGEAQRNAAEQPPEAAFSAEAGISEKHRMNTQRPFPYLCNTGAERSAVFYCSLRKNGTFSFSQTSRTKSSMYRVRYMPRR